MKQLLLFILSIFLVAPVYGQDKDLHTQDMKAWERGADLVRTKIGPRNVIGNPFYNDKWLKGYVLLNDTTKSDQLDLKYSTYNNKLLFQKDGKKYVATSKNVTGFVFQKNNKNVVFKNGFSSSHNHISQSLFLRIIYGGKTKLVSKQYTTLHKSNAPNPLTGETNDRFISKKKYYLITVNGKFHKIKLKRKDVLGILSDSKNKLKKYSKQNNLDFGKENDLKHILNYYDSLEP